MIWWGTEGEDRDKQNFHKGALGPIFSTLNAKVLGENCGESQVVVSLVGTAQNNTHTREFCRGTSGYCHDLLCPSVPFWQPAQWQSLYHCPHSCAVPPK